MNIQCGGRAEAARQAHNLEVAGSIPAPAIRLRQGYAGHANSPSTHNPFRLRAVRFAGQAIEGHGGRADAMSGPAVFKTLAHTDSLSWHCPLRGSAPCTD